MTTTESLTPQVSEPASDQRFLERLTAVDPSAARSLLRDAALLSDVQALVAYSPLFEATILQDPGHIAWLKRERRDTRVRDKQTLLESLGRFALTHSSVEPKVILARFRKRELMRIFLRDLRRLAAMAEITEEISNLADAVLEYALRLSRQEMDNRFGQPQEMSQQGRLRLADFCIIALGKLGSKELNYSSDIDLLFIFSKNGTTSGSGTRGATSNLEYFSRLTQAILNIVGGQGGEGAAYRVDMRLRPHGRIGPLALTLEDTIRYYRSEAAPWERQVLIRSRSAAGSDKLFQRFFRSVAEVVFSTDVNVETALANVAHSKQKIDLQKVEVKGTDIKLGSGGIREIEFIAQALQLAYGGKDKWLRVPHTLISLDRLAQRGHLNSKELTQLFDAYDFFRRLEHILQIEDGLQTHLVPGDAKKRAALAERFGSTLEALDSKLDLHRSNVHRIFARIFNKGQPETSASAGPGPTPVEIDPYERIKRRLKERAPKFLEVVNAHPDALETIADPADGFPERDYVEILNTAVLSAKNFGDALSGLRRTWYRHLIEIVVFDAFGKLELSECKRLQSRLAKASIAAALTIAKKEAAKRSKPADSDPPLAILSLGKLAGGGLDYDSDLDLVFVHGNVSPEIAEPNSGDVIERYSRVIEIFSTVLSSITRDGHLYRVDLRLRAHGSDGPLVISNKAIVEYFEEQADIWELLAYVNLRAVGGDIEFAQTVENEISATIRERASKIDVQELATETRQVRNRLEKQRGSKRLNEIDFKYGAGGLLDVYFAVRFIQLRYGFSADTANRGTSTLLDRMAKNDSLSTLREPLAVLVDAYSLLSALDHLVRLRSGRTSRIHASLNALDSLVDGESIHMRLTIKEQLIASLCAAREAFDRILSFECD